MNTMVQTFIPLFALLFILFFIIPAHSFPNIHPLYGLLFILLFIIQEISGPTRLCPDKKYQVERRATTPWPSSISPPPPARTLCPFIFSLFLGVVILFGNIPLWICFAASSFVDLGYHEQKGFGNWLFFFFFGFSFLSHPNLIN